jgi:hypothetical protein
MQDGRHGAMFLPKIILETLKIEPLEEEFHVYIHNWFQRVLRTEDYDTNPELVSSWKTS